MLIYQILIRLLSPLIWLVIIIEAIKGKDGWHFFFQKTGLKLPNLPTTKDSPIWIHCASVGEVKAAEPLVRALSANHTILITTNTATSKPLIHELYGTEIEHCYLPFDWPYALRRFVRKYNPPKLWIMETEIWPNLFRVANKADIEICILNGRLTAKTFKTPGWLQAAYRNSLRRVDKIIARSNKDAENFKKLGATDNQLTVLGNIKYAAQPETVSHAKPINREFVLAASTHEDEELQITQAWLELKRPELLVIVPRHPKRSANIQKQLGFLGDLLQTATKGQTPSVDTVVYLDDRIGKLMPLYAHAKLVIMGGSFVPKGGHNILEPAAFKKAIISGPDSRDFADEMRLLKEQNGIIQLEKYSELQNTIQELLENPQEAEILGNNALNALQKQKNTLKNYLSVLQIS